MTEGNKSTMGKKLSGYPVNRKCGMGERADGGANTPLANLHHLTAFRLAFSLSRGDSFRRV